MTASPEQFDAHVKARMDAHVKARRRQSEEEIRKQEARKAKANGHGTTARRPANRH
jgi:hypothetical protein